MATAVTNKDLDKSGLMANSLDNSHINHNKSVNENAAEGVGDKLYSDEIHDEEILQHPTFKVLQQTLEDPQLLDEPMYIKLRARITAFFVKHELDRKRAAKKNPATEEGELESMEGFAIQLYKCLRQMMLHIINLKEMHMKKTQLRQVYEWFFQRLKAIGALSKQEIEEEFKFLNPDHG